jgi:hypothetical protein
MQTKHTPEPWHVGCQNDAPFIINQPPRPSTDDIVDIPDVIVIAKPAEIPGNAATVVANAERIVACVNALAGLNPEAIKDAVEVLEAYMLRDSLEHDDFVKRFGFSQSYLDFHAGKAFAKLKEGQQC